MNCIGPIKPDDIDLLAYADDAASCNVLEHVAACAACQVRAFELSREQRVLQVLLHRSGCPAPLALGEYHLGLATEQQASEVIAHLTHCSACRAELADLAAFMQRLHLPVADAAEDAFGALRTITARLSLGLFPGPSGAPAPALRSAVADTETAPLVYSAEDVFVTVDSWIERLGQPGRVVAGLVVGPVDLTGAEAHMAGAQGASTTPINNLGNFHFADVGPGAHHLVIRLPATGIQIEIGELLVK